MGLGCVRTWGVDVRRRDDMSFVGVPFVVPLFRHFSASGTRAGSGGYSYLFEPMWWAGMISRSYPYGCPLGSSPFDNCVVRRDHQSHEAKVEVEES
uniref:Uncharacterized protein n=1 Tax=Cucumis melo TaxID=3656 RepID=A0A9I9EHZ3_CUCME